MGQGHTGELQEAAAEARLCPRHAGQAAGDTQGWAPCSAGSGSPVTLRICICMPLSLTNTPDPKRNTKKLWTLLNIQPQAQVSFLKRPSGQRPPSEALFTRDRYKKLYSGAITGNLSDELPNTNHRQIHGQPHEKENPTELHGS